MMCVGGLERALERGVEAEARLHGLFELCANPKPPSDVSYFNWYNTLTAQQIKARNVTSSQHCPQCHTRAHKTVRDRARVPQGEQEHSPLLAVDEFLRQYIVLLGHWCSP